MQINDAIKYATRRLISSDSKRMDSEILLCSILKCNRVTLYTHAEKKLSELNKKKFEGLVNRRLKGYPIAYLTKQKEFWSHKLYIDETILIPVSYTHLTLPTNREV